MTATIRLRGSQSAEVYRKLRERAPYAIARALNKSGASASSIMARSAAKDLGLKVADVRGQFAESDARPDRLTYRVSTTGTRIPLYDFKARGPVPSRGRGRGVTYRLPGGRGRLEHAFIARMRSGHVGVFERKGRARLPIQEKFGPSLPHVFAKYLPIGQARGEEQLAKNLPHEIEFETRRIAASTS